MEILSCMEIQHLSVFSPFRGHVLTPIDLLIAKTLTNVRTPHMHTQVMCMFTQMIRIDQIDLKYSVNINTVLSKYQVQYGNNEHPLGKHIS